MRITEPSQIKKGETIYAVHAIAGFTDFAGFTDIAELTLLSDAYKYSIGDSYITDAADINPVGLFDRRLFLHDFNCGDHYNHHGLFTTKSDAEQYIHDYEAGIIHVVELPISVE